MRILFLSPRQCWPARSGAKLREYHFARALARDAELTYVYFAEPGAEPLRSADLPFCREIAGVPKPGAYTPIQMLQGALGRTPLPILNYTCAAMTATVHRLTAANRYDLIHLDSIHMIRYGEVAARNLGPGTRIVYNWHNIESEAMRRFGETVTSTAKRWYARQTAGKLESVERGMLRTASGHVVCSERERLQLNKIAPAARVAVVENGVDTQYFSGCGKPGHRLVFVGAMDYYPNVEAATSFATNVWPAVRARLPESSLTIVGANPVPAVRALAEVPGVAVTGTVPDVRPYYEGALAAIVPLRTGGGTRLKILEAMAAGVPVVSTPLGAEGLAVLPGTDILISEADDEASWIGNLTGLAGSPERYAQLRSAALDLVKNRYDWDLLGRKLSETYRAWIERS